MYEAYITRIKKLRKHENADRLQCCTVFGSNVIVDLSYYVGQMVVYFPVDGQLSEDFAEKNNLIRKKDENGNNTGGYLEPDKRNIRAIKLRGEKSDGLILPIETLADYVDISTLKEGDRISVLNGKEICRKYIPRRNRRNQNTTCSNKKKNTKEEKQKISYPFFLEHSDTEQLMYNQSAFRKNDTIYLTRKLHGTSFRVSNALELTKKVRSFWIKKLFHLDDRTSMRYNVISGTRRTVLRSYDGGFYGSNHFREKYNDFFAERLPKGFTVYGEICGYIDENTPIMPVCQNSKVKDKEFAKMYGKETVFNYGCKPGENKCWVYRITSTNEDGEVVELPTEEVMVWCERWGVEYVPLLEKFLYTTWDDLIQRCEKYLDVPEPLSNGSHVTEGVVVRIDNRSKFEAYKIKSFYFKVLEGIIKDTADAPDIEEAEEAG